MAAAKYSGTGEALAQALLVSTLLEPLGRGLADDPHQPAGPGGVCDLTSTIASDDSHSDGRRHATSMHAAGVDCVLQSRKPCGHDALIPSI